MSTVIINGIEYVPAKTVTGTRAAAEPVDVRHLDRSFRFDPDAQQHIPTLLVEFEPVSAVGGGDPKAKGWRDRDLLAMMLRGQPTAHIAPAEQPQPEPSADVRLLREMFALCEATEDECADTDDSFKRGRAFEAKRIRRGIGTWYQDTFCGPTHMGEPVLCAAPEPSEAEDAARYRWLRDPKNADRDEWNMFGPYSSPADIDAAIDNALRAAAAARTKC